MKLRNQARVIDVSVRQEYGVERGRIDRKLCVPSTCFGATTLIEPAVQENPTALEL
jgi:hypothetical protein